MKGAGVAEYLAPGAVHIGSVLDLAGRLEPQSVRTIITSPPYYAQRDYGIPPTFWPAMDYQPLAGLPALAIPEMTCCLGLESTLEAYVGHLVAIFRALAPVLHGMGTAWLNLGDGFNAYNGNRGTASQYAGKRNLMEPMFPSGHGLMAKSLKQKDLLGVPWRVAFALQADGWYLRSDIIWAKPNCMPESTRDRPTRSHEYLFLLAKGARYFYDRNAILEPLSEASITRINQPNFANQTGGEKDYGHGANTSRSARKALENFAAKPDGHGRRPAGFDDRWDNAEPPAGRNKRDVWTVPPAQFDGPHYAVFPEALIRPCVLAGSRSGDLVLDPFSGSGTTGEVAHQEGRRFIGIDLDERAVGWHRDRLAKLPVGRLFA